MKIDTTVVRKCLKAFEFETLFIEHLGWDRHRAQLPVTVGGETFSLSAVAEKRGFVAYVCASIPDRAKRLKIDHQVAKSAHEHFVIYADRKTGQQVWQWVRREPGRPMASRDHRFDVRQSGDPLIQRLEQIAVALEEEEKLSVVDMAGRTRQAFDVDKVTKKFYDRFKAEHAVFLKFIKGFPPPTKKKDEEIPHPDHQWYTSLMLNRLMFVYFIQKKGFLDGDIHYLHNRLKMIKEARGKDKFQTFYRYFLLRLFHDGLGKPDDERKLDTTLDKLMGRVPFLNGGFFEVHQLEQKYSEIDIPDKAFEKLFAFFDNYRWHLDERPLRADNEINPDVVGYIFEKYINQKQMGAYYTKEDITEYISKNTIIPFLFDAAEKKCAIAFRPDGALWALLRDDPDRYIYAAVKHGVVRDDGSIIPESDLPDFVQTGMHDPKARMHDNRYNLQQAPADDPLRLVTETWREYIARRTRCLEMREKLRNGGVHQINDLITLNLDIWQLARDAVVNAEGPELLRAFWHSIAGKAPEKPNERPQAGITVLDPTCGSGAFLFAALRILETLYSDCLERMERFVEDLEGRRHLPKQYSDFKEIRSRIDDHPNERYFIFKSIIINNLFGVDIMEEAVEICKLRLFLKLAAQVEPDEKKPNLGIEQLPDIDFNIRAGNTLVGYATEQQARDAIEDDMAIAADWPIIEESAQRASAYYDEFRRAQSDPDTKPEDQHGWKRALNDELQELRRHLDRALAKEFGHDDPVKNAKDFDAWKSSHEPFHWFVEFYGIMHAGGFDVIIGNPPYVASAKVRKTYNVRKYHTEKCTDIYAWCLERVSQLCGDIAFTGMIVPLSLSFSGDFSDLRSHLFSVYGMNWFSSFGRIPAALFAHDVRVRNTIHIGAKQGNGAQFTTRIHRWFDAERAHLLSLMSYSRFTPDLWSGRIPKLNTQSLTHAFELALERKRRLAFAHSDRPNEHHLYFKKTAYNWLNFCRKMPPCYDEIEKAIPHTQFGEVSYRSATDAEIAFLLLNGKIELAFWLAIGDDFHVTNWMFAELPVDFRLISPEDRSALAEIAPRLEVAMKEATSFKLNAGKRIGNYNLARCRSITDESDQIIARAFGFAEVWDDIELLYSQTVRTDFSEDAQEDV